MELKFNKEMEVYEEAILAIKQKEKELDDELILLKLSVTQSMIYNYQVNELPEIERLENLLHEYKLLIKESIQKKKQALNPNH